jgi:hypothetical protein
LKRSLAIGGQLLLIALLAGACLAGAPTKHPKMSSAIVDALHSGRLQKGPEQQPPLDPAFSLTSAGLQVYIEMVEVSDATLAELRALGVTIEVTDPRQRLVQARVPPAQLEAVAGLPSVRFIRLPDYGVHNRQSSIGLHRGTVARLPLIKQASDPTGSVFRLAAILGWDSQSHVKRRLQ